jgi:excisionase family DNA binding protein
MLSSDVREMLHISKTTLTKYIKEGMPHIRLGKKLLFEMEAVEKWIKEKTSN